MQSPFAILPDAGILWRNIRACHTENIYNAYYAGIITYRDLKMLGFLAAHRVATVSQLARACYPGKNKVRERLRRFAGWRLLDSFTWADGQKNTKPVVYCLGPGSAALMQELYPELAGHNCNLPEQVRARQDGWRNNSIYDAAALLLANEFILRAGPVICDYTAEPYYKIGSTRLVPTATFTAGGTPLIMRVIRGGEHLIRFKSELPLYEQLIEGPADSDKNGKKPVLLLICESDRQAVNLARYISVHSTLTRYRLSTDSSVLFNPPHLAFSTLEKDQLVTKVANIFRAPFDREFQASTT